jgi:hypothetical protein
MTMADDTRRILPGEAAPTPPPPAFAALAQTNGMDDSPIMELPDGRRVVLGRPKGSVIALVVKITAELTRDMTV